MAQSFWKVIIEGTVRQGEDAAEVKRKLARLFRVEEGKVAGLLNGKAVVIKKEVDRETAVKYQRALAEAGAACRIEEMEEDLSEISSLGTTVEPKTEPEASKGPALANCPKCNYSPTSPEDGLLKDGICPACGIVVQKFLARQKEREKPKETLPAIEASASAPPETSRKADEKFCVACGRTIHFSAESCPSCGARQGVLPGSPLSQTLPTKSPDQRYCVGCGTLIHITADMCPRCGARQHLGGGETSKNKVVAGLLALFLGGVGIHKFYLGRIGLGVVYLMLFWTFIPAIIGFFEGIWYLAMDEENFHDRVRMGRI
jgi:TM2 domain-containing membrane protein YozV